MNKKFILISLCVLPILGYAFSEGYWARTPKESKSFELKLTNKEFLLLTLTSELNSINAALPKQLDAHTILTRISVENETVINKHTIVDISESDLSEELITSALIPRLVHQVCLDEQKRKFLDNDIDIIMEYYDIDEVLIFKIQVVRKDCS